MRSKAGDRRVRARWLPAGYYLARLLMVGIETGVSKMDQPGLHRLRVQDRAELAKLLTALNGAMNALRRDECGDPTIFGSRGHIRACDGSSTSTSNAALPCTGPTPRRQLASFSMVHQDGDQEGVVLMAKIIYAGCR